MKEFTKYYEYSESLSDCLRDIEKIADVCAIIGNSSSPQINLVDSFPNIINACNNLEHDGETSCFYIAFSKNDCEVGQDLDDVKDELFGGKALFLIKLTMKYRVIPTKILDSRDITMEVKVEI